MKRLGNLWPQIIEFDNLLAAARKAQRGKRYQENVMRFNDRLGDELLQHNPFQLQPFLRSTSTGCLSPTPTSGPESLNGKPWVTVSK